MTSLYWYIKVDVVLLVSEVWCSSLVVLMKVRAQLI